MLQHGQDSDWTGFFQNILDTKARNMEVLLIKYELDISYGEPGRYQSFLKVIVFIMDLLM